MGKHQLDLELKKALTTASNDGGVLIPEVVSAGVRQFVETRSPLLAMIEKPDWPTNAYIHRDVTGLPSAYSGAEGAALGSASKGTYSKPTVPMKSFYTRGEVTGQMIAAGRALLDVYQEEIELHGIALARYLEQTILTGDVDTDADDFDGMVAQITDAAANIIDPGTAVPLVLNHLDQAIDKPQLGEPSIIVGTRACARRINSLMQAQQRFINEVDVAGGFRVMTYNGLPILKVDNLITGLDDKVLLPDLNWTRMPVLQPVTFEPLGKTKDSEDFFLKTYCTLALEGASMYHAMIKDVDFTVS
jgi:HK97 family phage major capsid protein